jgi:hypothetical protein
MEYQCKRCGYQTRQKCHLVRHLQSVTPCKEILSVVTIDELLRELQHRTLNEKTYTCEWCEKEFNSRSSKSRHKKTCNATNTQKEIYEFKRQIAELKAEQAKHGSLINKGTINNNMQNNIHIHVVPRDFAINENTSYLDKGFLLECFKDMDLVKVLEELHFNPEHPENHNVRVKNVKQNLMEYIDAGKWVEKKKDEVLQHLIMNGYRVLHTYYKKNKDDVEDELEDSQVDESLQWLKKIYDEDKSLYKELKNDAFLLVMSNKALLIGK